MSKNLNKKPSKKEQRLKDKLFLFEEILTIFDTEKATRTEILRFLHLLIAHNRTKFENEYLKNIKPILQKIYTNFIQRKINKDD